MTRLIHGQVAYKLVRVGRANCKTHFYKFNIPAEIGDRVPEDTRFFVEVCEEGILLRRTEQKIESESPSWMRTGPLPAVGPQAEPVDRANGVAFPVGNEGGAEAQESLTPPDTVQVIKKRGYSRSGR